ncbi:hypothetical protein HYE28_00895 [Mycoplasmopsis bovis]|nr:hypothetical protein HYE28_00895 [Mycoplasmopsis bovis]
MKWTLNGLRSTIMHLTLINRKSEVLCTPRRNAKAKKKIWRNDKDKTLLNITW